MELVVSIETPCSVGARVEAGLTRAGRQRHLVVRQPATSRCCVAAGTLHLDLSTGHGPVISMSLDARNERLLVAQTPLLRASGLPVGTFDPPVATRVRSPVASTRNAAG